ncbi:MAG: hypothetical protein K2O35_06150 [Clostridia bacterium]|nr:hypothetical protein [Clostridia bacterium]
MKKFIIVFILVLFILSLTACGLFHIDGENKQELLGFQAWEDFIYESIQDRELSYTLKDANEEPILLHYFNFRCGNIYDKNGNKIENYYRSASATHNWYILEKSNNREIVFNFKSVENESGLINMLDGSKDYFTNRVLTTDEYNMSGFNFSATNGVDVYDVKKFGHYDFHGNHTDDLKDVTYPIRVDATEFEATKILSRTTGIITDRGEEYSYVNYHIYKVIIAFVDNFDKAIVKTYDFVLSFNADYEEHKALDKAYFNSL